MREGRGEREGKKKNQTGGRGWRRGEPRGQLLEGLVGDFQPLTSVAASSPTPSRHKGPRRPPRARRLKGDGAQLDLVEKLFTSGTLHPTMEPRERETERKRDGGTEEIVY